jgi:hypothetical protein
MQACIQFSLQVSDYRQVQIMVTNRRPGDLGVPGRSPKTRVSLTVRIRLAEANPDFILVVHCLNRTREDSGRKKSERWG